jgi:hypothetical protein
VKLFLFIVYSNSIAQICHGEHKFEPPTRRTTYKALPQ